VWKFVADSRGDGHQHPSPHDQTLSQQLQVQRARFLHRISVPNHRILYFSCPLLHRHRSSGHPSRTSQSGTSQNPIGTSQIIIRDRELPPNHRVADERSFRSGGESTSSVFVICDARRACRAEQARVDSRAAFAVPSCRKNQLSVSHSIHVFFQTKLQAELDRSTALSALHAEVSVCRHPCNTFSSTATQDVQALSSKLAAAESRAAAADAAFASASASSKQKEEAAAVERSALEKQLQLASGGEHTCRRSKAFALTRTRRPTAAQHRASRSRRRCAARQRRRCAARRRRSRSVDEKGNIRGASTLSCLKYQLPSGSKSSNCNQERRRADNADASVRSLLQRLDDANKALAVQKQFAEAAAAVAAADLLSMTQRAVRAEKQAQEFQDSLNSMQVCHCICAHNALQRSI
jgi:hypothetical protein